MKESIFSKWQNTNRYDELLKEGIVEDNVFKKNHVFKDKDLATNFITGYDDSSFQLKYWKSEDKL